MPHQRAGDRTTASGRGARPAAAIAGEASLRIVELTLRPNALRFDPGVDSSTLIDGMDKPKILTAKELRAIMPRLSAWKLARNKLSRTFEFQDFVQSLSFVNSLVAYFETMDHHPDVYIAYGEVTFELTRYDLGGKITVRRNAPDRDPISDRGMADQ